MSILDLHFILKHTHTIYIYEKCGTEKRSPEKSSDIVFRFWKGASKTNCILMIILILTKTAVFFGPPCIWKICFYWMVVEYSIVVPPIMLNVKVRLMSMMFSNRMLILCSMVSILQNA